MTGTWGFCPVCGEKLAPKNIETFTRLACTHESCDFVHWENPIPVVAGIIEYQGNILLARNALWPPKMFGLITGFLEKHEHPDACMKREVKEEINLEVDTIDFFGHYSFPRLNQLIMVYHLTCSGEIVTGEEIAEVKLLPAEKVRAWPQGTGPALQDWLDIYLHKK